MLIHLFRFMISRPLSMNLQKPNAFLLYKTCILELKPFFFSTFTKKMPINDFILVLCNKINFLRQIVRHPYDIPYVILLVCIFFQSLQEGNSKSSYFFPKIAFIVTLYSCCFFLNTSLIHQKENIQEV